MKTTKMLTILVLALGLMVWPVEVSEAVPMGTAFTYQGRLMDANSAAEGGYDFHFKLFDANESGTQKGPTIDINDLDVIDGYFTVELDFGSSVFNGNARWLEIGVRPGVESDPCEYTPLSPRQEVTAVPYALQTRGIFVDDALNVGIGGINPSWRLTVEEGGLNVFAGSSGETVGFSTSRFYVANNEETWIMDIGESPSDYIEFFDDGSSVVKIVNNKVGIGTQSPDAKLDISGDVKATGSVAASDAVIMATNTGSGDGVQGETWSSSGRGVEGWALYSGSGANYGGYFRADGSGGYGVYGYASNSGNYENYGGYFMASGDQGRGVYGFVMGDNGHAVQGMAFDSGSVENYGGYFTARGASGRGVYGEASKTGTVENYGGYFTAAGDQGRGVYGEATGSDGVGVYGGASATTGTNYGGYFEAAGISGRGVYGEASAIFGTNYGGWFAASGSSGTGVYGSASGGAGMGVYGEATDSGVATNYGGYFKAAGSSGRGVYGKASNSGAVSPNYGGYFEASGSSGRGVYGWASNAGNVTNYGGWFEAWGDSGRGVYGKATGSDGRGVYGYATGSDGYGVYGYGPAGGYDFYAAGPGTDYGTSSSIRWKSDVRAIDDPLGKILRLRGVYFNWDAEHGGGHDVGMIAEEVGAVLPEIVMYEENGVDAIGMDYSKLTPLLVEAVKALKIEADERQKQHKEKDAIIERLQQENRALLKRVAAIEEMVGTAHPGQRRGLSNEAF